ncbi:RagB/SusD family nutrient uptake outer membrane protein [uncultured Flavobacterium sp.]|uniref:RagB/SusD family nutrient uptake outer membrane protein n=1 Tax=uncultured Flavobacterium sp. TaxID=165435 RepID=UPI00122B3631|nr:RagB/SusD family nutrient uptake outer membrane protein [uncultured Flavobacterium sp.]THD30603.1 MAG: RagB/SusD family nutrient uptake outer membrane protein [Flavobacterium johnsoniae]
MKKSILLLPIFFLMLLSCSDAYDIVQDNELPEDEAYVTIGHLRSGLNGAYAAYGPDFGGDAIAFNDLFTDNIRRGPNNNGQGAEEYNFLIQPNSDMPTAVWSNRYATINRVNRVLRAYDRLFPTFNEVDQRNAKHVKGNLLALRALCHLDLFQYFTVDYKNLSAPSVIKMDFVPNSPFDVYPRNTVGEILTFIKQDLTDAKTFLAAGLQLAPGETVLPSSLTAYNSPIYLREVAVDFIRCRVAMLEGDYPTAESIATTILATPAFDLANRAAYLQMYGNADAPGECIFKLSRVLNNNSILNLFYFNTNSTGPIDPYLTASKQLYDLFPPVNSANNPDVRRVVLFGNVVDPANIAIDNYPIRKYVGSADGPTINDVKLFRSSELKLIVAECKARNSDFLGAATAVKELRDKRITTTNVLPTYTSLNAALTDILLERRKEFAFEGHRYLDLKRIGGEINVGINRLESDAFSFSAPTSLAAGDYRFTLPIPTVELTANPTIVQNPNY